MSDISDRHNYPGHRSRQSPSGPPAPPRGTDSDPYPVYQGGQVREVERTSPLSNVPRWQRYPIYARLRPYAAESINNYLSIYGKGFGQRQPDYTDAQGEAGPMNAPGEQSGYSDAFNAALTSATNRTRMSDGGGGGGASGPQEVPPVPPLGDIVHPDWRVDPKVYSEMPVDEDGNPLPPEALAPPVPYYTHDDLIIPIKESWSSDRILRIQKQMEEANLLQKDTYRPGEWGSQTQQAFQQILISSNQNARPWDETLANFQNNPIPEPMPARESWVPETFIRPNPENVGESVYNMISQLVGSDYADDARVARLTQSFLDESRAAFEEKQELERQAFEYSQTQELANQTEHSFEDLAAHAEEEYGVEVTKPPEEAEITDPEQSMQRETREELEGIMSAQEEQERTQQSRATLGQIFGSMSRWAGGR